MKKFLAIGAIGLVGVALAAAVFVGMGTDTGPDVEDVGRRSVGEVAVGERQDPETTTPRPKKTGPDGREIDMEGKEVRTAGLPERPPPIDAGTDWNAKRIESDRRWHAAMVENIAGWARNSGLEEGDRQQVTAAVNQYTTEVATVRANVREGTLSRQESRAQLDKLRTNIREQVTGQVGEDKAEELNSYLQQRIVGGGW